MVSLHAAAYKAVVSEISPPHLDVISIPDRSLHSVSLRSRLRLSCELENELPHIPCTKRLARAARVASCTAASFPGGTLSGSAEFSSCKEELSGGAECFGLHQFRCTHLRMST